MKPILIPIDKPITIELLEEVAEKCYNAGYDDGKNTGIVIPHVPNGWRGDDGITVTPYYTGDMPFTFCDSKTSDVSIRATT